MSVGEICVEGQIDGCQKKIIYHPTAGHEPILLSLLDRFKSELPQMAANWKNCAGNSLIIEEDAIGLTPKAGTLSDVEVVLNHLGAVVTRDNELVKDITYNFDIEITVQAALDEENPMSSADIQKTIECVIFTLGRVKDACVTLLSGLRSYWAKSYSNTDSVEITGYAMPKPPLNQRLLPKRTCIITFNVKVTEHGKACQVVAL